MIGQVPRRYIHYAYAGGAPTEPAQHSGYVLLGIPKGEVPDGDYKATVKDMSKKLRAGERREFPLRAFCESPSVMSGNAAVSRVDVVRYVANKLGGVHWDNERGGWASYQGSRHRLLDEQHIVVGGLPGALYEVVSIAHDVASAPDILKLMEVIERKAPEQVPDGEILMFREGRVGKYTDLKFSSNSSRLSLRHRFVRWFRSVFTA